MVWYAHGSLEESMIMGETIENKVQLLMYP